MVLAHSVTKQKYEENSFTSLFSLIKRYQLAANGLPVLAFPTDDIKLIYQYADDAIRILLQGLQDVGNIINKQNANCMVKINNIGFLVTAISNLIEALDSLREDACYTLNNP